MRELLRAVGRTALAALALLWLLPLRPLAAQETGDLAIVNGRVVARSPGGMVVTGAPLATAVGVRVLEEGGNAVDAAVAAAFALAVVEPTMSGIGGRTQLLVRTPDGRFAGIDGTTEVPAGFPTDAPVGGEDAYGYATIGIPGTVAALARAIEEHGTWPLARAMAPAIALAEDGFRLPAAEADRIAGVAGRLAEFEGSRRLFLRADGTPYRAGDRFRQPELAATLRAVAAGGPEAFYRGPIAERMAADIRGHGGWLTVEDLARYQERAALVVRGRYRGHDLVGTYLPASGATTIEVLQILEHFDLPAIAGSPAWAAIVAQALLFGFEDREAAVTPDATRAWWLVSPERAAARANRVRLPAGTSRADGTVDGTANGVGPRVGLPVGRATPAFAMAIEPEHTTHLSIIDGRGGAVALTQSVGPLMGSKVASPGLGFVYAATMGYLGSLAPGDRPWSSQSPLIVERDGRPVYVLGGAGARRIIPAIVETLSRAIDQGLPFDRAMAAPRFHVLPNRIDAEVRPGAAWSPEEIAALRSHDFEVRARSDPPYFARIHAIHYDAATGEYVGVADPRWEGAAAGPRR